MDVKEVQKSAKLRKKEKSAKRPEEKKSTKNVKDDSSSEDGSSEDEEAVEKNVKFMTNLSEKDPEFFEFLKVRKILFLPPNRTITFEYNPENFFFH